MDDTRRKSLAASLSVASNSLLLGLKLVVGLSVGSVSVISEAIHSGIDLLAALIAWFAVRRSGRPADEEHPFGHGKIENLSGSIEALLIFLAALWILYEAGSKLFHAEPIESPGWGTAVMFLSVVVNVVVSSHLFRVGRETGSVALTADAWHLRTDVYTSAGVMGALGLIQILGVLRPELRVDWIDPVAAMGVALLIVRAAWRLTAEAGRDLLDERLPAEEIEVIHVIAMEVAPDLHSLHRLRTRRAGADRFIEFHLVVDPDMTVEVSHALTDEIDRRIRERWPGTSLTIHVEPCDAACSDACRAGCRVPERQRGG
jgi:cation diffusion facilitator family transporter